MYNVRRTLLSNHNLDYIKFFSLTSVTLILLLADFSKTLLSTIEKSAFFNGIFLFLRFICNVWTYFVSYGTTTQIGRKKFKIKKRMHVMRWFWVQVAYKYATRIEYAHTDFFSFLVQNLLIQSKKFWRPFMVLKTTTLKLCG